MGTILVGALARSHGTRAADTGVCGDGAVDADEQCDDGNLLSGDGCSATCMTERCGNGIVDVREQCDAGPQNGVNGNSCSHECLIRFCGDGVVDSDREEQCDDGNTLDGDGCSSTCLPEGIQIKKQSEESQSSESLPSQEPPSPQEPPSALPPPHQSAPPPPPAPPATPPTTTQPLPVTATMADAATAARSIQSPEAQDIIGSLPEKDREALSSILRKLASGQRLTKEERGTAGNLAGALQQSEQNLQETYTDLLRRFISTPISTTVVQESNMTPEDLTNQEISRLTKDLSANVTPIPPERIPAEVMQRIADLRRLDVPLSALPENYRDTLLSEQSPLTVFRTMTDIKEAIEAQATDNLPSSLEILRNQAATLRGALPFLERSYGIAPGDVQDLLDRIGELTQEKSPDLPSLTRSVDRLLLILEKHSAMSRRDLTVNGTGELHGAAKALALAGRAAEPGQTVTADTAPAVVQALADQAPAAYRQAFDAGSTEEQRVVLRKFLTTDEHIRTTLATLDEATRAQQEARFEDLLQNVDHAGESSAIGTPCGTSVSAALDCTDTFLQDLESAARNRSILTKVVTGLQDYFGIHP